MNRINVYLYIHLLLFLYEQDSKLMYALEYAWDVFLEQWIKFNNKKQKKAPQTTESLLS